ncbi:small RNA degrading nuclease 1-like [Aegilops tauschii subsp. strangulata]|uniref:Small RNA degrading nuclease 1 n=1 Tax=Aegilops tauschii TaxID=37682 RepID=M8C949_AEGTA
MQRCFPRPRKRTVATTHCPGPTEGSLIGRQGCLLRRRQCSDAGALLLFLPLPLHALLGICALVRQPELPPMFEGWKVMRIGKVSSTMNAGAMLAIDCEMVLCHDGTEAVVRVCVVDNKLKKKTGDYRTYITGVSKKDLGVTCSLLDIQKSLKKILAKGKILVGHSLYRDLYALKFDYSRVIDTAYIFKYANLPTTSSASLNSLCKSVCGYSVREDGEPHNCLKDAEAAMNLVTAKLKHGFNDPIEIAENSVPEPNQMKLLAHRIPVYLPCQVLLKFFSGNPSIDEKIDSRIQGEFYSMCISFNDIDETYKAFDELDGQETKDSSVRLQKSVLLKRDNGDVAGFFVRKMVYGSRLSNSEVLKKRPHRTQNTEQKKEDANGDKRKMQRTSKKHVKKAKAPVVE